MAYWAFLGSPKHYDVERAVQELSHGTWLTKGRKVQRGDWALIWKAQGNTTSRGIVGFAEVLSDPISEPDPNPEYWLQPGEARTPQERVRVRFVRALNLPLWLDEHLDLLEDLSLVRATGGTVFRVTEEQWDRIVAAAGGALS